MLIANRNYLCCITVRLPYSVIGTIRDVVFRFGIENGGPTEWNFLFKQYTNSNNILDKRRMLTALSYTRVPWLIRRYNAIILKHHIYVVAEF